VEAQSHPDLWREFHQRLRVRITPASWQTWLEPLEGHVEGDLVRFVAPSEFHLQWVQDRYARALQEEAAGVFGPQTTIRLDLRSGASEIGDDDITEKGPAASPPPPPVPPQSAPTFPPSQLVKKYTFDDFVVGPSNRFAHAAAMAVAEQPGQHYNPLFIYGGAGLGKTHLLHAVGHNSRELSPGAVVRYVSSEQFFTEFINGIRRKTMDDFKGRYRNLDLLLLDDVQFFEGKEQILEEFFHTFNSLYEADAQMVISSDRHPRHLATLEDRLRSRFEWGLLTDIQPPDVETRLAILRKNAEFAPIPVPEEVLGFIASHVLDNIRELEGALTRVTAFAALTKETISLEMAQQVLSDIVPPETPKKIEPEEIIRMTAEAYDLPVEDLLGPSRKQPLATARQIAMYLIREHTSLSLPKIGARFGDRDHTTVLHAVDRVKGKMKSDQDVFDRVNVLSQRLRKT
jgi:chromosomal replication initiator protein